MRCWILSAGAKISTPELFELLVIQKSDSAKTSFVWFGRCALRRASLRYRSENLSRHSEKLAPEIKRVSPERLRDELTKLLTEGAARRGFELLDETKLLPEILPELRG